MAYVTPATMADGAVINADRWNQDVVNNTIFLYSPPYARLDNSTTQNISAATLEIVEFDTATDDNDSMADLDNNRLVIQTAGLYVVSGMAELIDVSGAGEEYIQLLHSSGQILASLSVDHNALTTFHTVTAQKFFAVGESVTLQVYLSAGSSAGLTGKTHMAAHWLRGVIS